MVQENWKLTSGDTIAIPAANRANGVASTWSDIWQFKVPVGQKNILLPTHKFHAKLYIAGPTEVTDAGCQIRIMLKDQTLGGGEVIYGPTLYVTSKEPVDVTKMALLNLSNSKLVDETFYIIVQAYYASVIVENLSSFSLETIRYR
jgi:hypothetical protein